MNSCTPPNQEKDEKKWTRFLPLILAAVGAVGGYLYYALVGCATGTCAITSDPVTSTLFGAAIGVLIGVAAAPGGKEPPQKSPFG